MKNKSVLFTLVICISALVLSAQTKGTFTDARDGKTYNTVTIGKQIWMAENLAYKPATGYYAPYNNDSSLVKIYGYLYDYETALKSCPAGWHLPSDAEWTLLTDFLGNQEMAGKKLVSATGWKGAVDTSANSSGFTALPGGFCYMNGTFDRIGLKGFWWSSTESGNNTAWYRSIFSDDFKVNRYDDYKDYKLSVRCIKD